MNTDPNLLVRPILNSEIEILQKMAKTTFLLAFGPDNNPDDMEKYVEEKFSLEHLQKEMANPESRFYFVERDKQKLGYLKVNWGQAQTEGDLEEALEIERIYVLPEYQRQRVGQALFQKAVEVAKELKFDSVWLGVWEENTKALSFYKKNGFEVVGTHSFLLGDDLQTDLMMRVRV